MFDSSNIVAVKNVKWKEGDPKPKKNSFEEDWKDSGKKWPDDCQRCRCEGGAEVAAHVNKVDRFGNKIGDKMYLVPLCKSCNNVNNTEPFRVPESMLVETTAKR